MAKKPIKTQQYEAHKKRAAARQAKIAAEGQEIGTPPDVVDAARRDSCRNDFKLFCETYFREWFYLGWSIDHEKAISKIQDSVLSGMLFALAMPRGSGKTVLCLAAVLWALLYGHHRFVCLIAATDQRAKKLLSKIYNALEQNKRLMEDFPLVCYPIKKLERTPQRSHKQKCMGEYTNMTWTANEIVLPTVAGSLPSGAIVTVAGLTSGELLGQNKDMPDGSIMRPSLFMADDIQTKSSAKSASQCEARIEILQAGVLGLAGPDKKIAGLLTCTIIRPGDAAEQLLDREAHPEWQGERCKLVYEWPKNEKLWDEYTRLYQEGLRGGDKGTAATEFYKSNRPAMDAGSRVGWPARFPEGCLSALQNAYNLRIRDEDAFQSEYQNEPLSHDVAAEWMAKDDVARKINGRQAGTIPTACSHLTLYTDVHNKLLYWMLAAWQDDFTGYVVEYGTYPDQGRAYFTMRQAQKTMQAACPGAGREGAIYAGLKSFYDWMLNRQWTRDDGSTMRINLALVDERYETKTVYQFINEYPCGYLHPAMGLPLGATSAPFHSRANKPGERSADHCRMTMIPGKARGRHIVIDTNYWKTFIQRRILQARGDSGCLTIYGRFREDGQPASPTQHLLLAEHLTAEKHHIVFGPYGPVDIWENQGGKDNHWLDCLCGCAVGAAWLGASTIRTAPATPARVVQAVRKSWAEVAKEKKGLQ